MGIENQSLCSCLFERPDGTSSQAVNTAIEPLLHQPSSAGSISLEQAVDNLLCLQSGQVLVRLAHSNKHYRCTACIHHRQRSTHLVVNGIKLGEHNAVNQVWFLPARGQVRQALVELGQLVNSVIADERFADKEHEIGVVAADKGGKGAHKGLVILHTAYRWGVRMMVMKSGGRGCVDDGNEEEEDDDDMTNGDDDDESDDDNDTKDDMTRLVAYPCSRIERAIMTTCPFCFFLW